MGERDDYMLDVLAHELGNSKNSRLYRRLVLADELVTDVNVMNETRQDPGSLMILCELRDGVPPAKVELAVREEIAALIDEGVGKKDMERIQAQIRASFLFQDESVLDLAMKLGRFEAGTPEGYRTLASVLPTYESITQKELRAAAAKYFDFERAAVVWAVPAKPENGKGKDGKKQKGKRKEKQKDKDRHEKNGKHEKAARTKGKRA
jgi:predicted Zn-dependent peptidase